MSRQLISLRKQISQLLKESFSIGPDGNLVTTSQDDNQFVDTINKSDKPEPFNSTAPKELTISALKYHLENLPLHYRKVLNASDAKIIREPDHPEGIFTVHSKSMNDYFDFSYNHTHAEDFTIFLPRT